MTYYLSVQASRAQPSKVSTSTVQAWTRPKTKRPESKRPASRVQSSRVQSSKRPQSRQAYRPCVHSPAFPVYLSKVVWSRETDEFQPPIEIWWKTNANAGFISLIHSHSKLPWYRNQSTGLQIKLINWFLYDEKLNL